jgi:hypothetical protein
MAEEIFKLKTLDVDNTVIRQSRVGFKNNPTSKMVFASPDVEGEEIYSGETGIYSGERYVNTEYLIQGSVQGNNIRTEATFTIGSKDVVLTTAVEGISGGDFIRNDIDTSFFEIKSVSGLVLTLSGPYSSTSFQGTALKGPATIRKTALENAEFEYAKSTDGQNSIFFNQEKLEWGVTGIQFEGPIDTQKEPYVFPTDDYMVAQFQKSATSGAPVITSVKSERFTVVNDNKNAIPDLGLNAVPYPHESLKVYWGPKDKPLSLKQEGEDYVVNYSQEPDYQFPFPPIEDRQVAFLKFLEDLKENQATINEEFQGYSAISKKTTVPGAKDLVTPVTDIVQETERVTVSNSVLERNKDYLIEYQSGLVTFIDHRNNEQIVESVTYPSSLLWDGISVIKGVSADKVKGSLSTKDNPNLVIRPISGLSGIDTEVYFEDVEENNLLRDEDYILEYDSGAIRINDALEENECVLVTYYVEGVQEENEDLTKAVDLRTKKFPVMAGSVILTKTYTDVLGKDRSKVLEEGVDYEVSVLTGVVRPLADSLVVEEVKSLRISYIPTAEINVILQPYSEDVNSFKMTIVDDALETTSPSVLKFKVRNPQVSVPVEDPFKGDSDPSKVSYNNSIIEGSILNVGIRVRSGYGTPSEEALIPGVTARGLGVDSDLDFNLTGYTYDDKLKEIQLDESINDARPDYNDIVVMSYSFIGDSLPYAPVEAIFPFIGEGGNKFYIEGHDRTDLLKPNSVIRVDNYNPEETYYFKIKSVSFIGESTQVEIYGSFPKDIRNPSFHLFDTDVVFTGLPIDTKVDRGLKPGSNTVILSGNLLQISEAISQNSLLEIDGTEIYNVLAVTVADGVVAISIFPNLQSYITGEVLVSTFSVKEEGTTVVSPQLGAITEPAQPAFTISFVPPTTPVELSGRGLITIDTEKIILQEVVSGNLNPEPYLFYFKDYVDTYSLSKAIQGTVSTFLGLRYNPFTVSAGGKEQYYLGEGYWASDTIVSFAQGTEESLPYTVAVSQDLYKWKVISAEKGINKFKVEEVDISSSFSEGNLIAFTSNVTGDTYYHIVQGAEAPEPDSDGILKDTIITLKDELRLNFTNPSFYRYNNPVWLDFSEAYAIDTLNSSLIVDSDVTSVLRPSMFLKFGDKYLYKIDSVSFEGGSSTIRLSPDIYAGESLLISQEYYPGYIKYTDIPLYINEKSHQPSIVFTYTEAYAHTGYAEVLVDDEKVEVSEYVDGSEIVSKKSIFNFSDYQDIYALGLAVMDTESAVPGHKPFGTDVGAYQGLYEEGSFQRLSIVPTYGVVKKLPYRALVSQGTFRIDYTIASGYSGTANIKRTSASLILKENLVHSLNGSFEEEYVLNYEDFSDIYGLISAINSTVSRVSGITPFTAVDFNGVFSPASFFTRGVYSVPSTVSLDFSTLGPSVLATTVSDSWVLQGPQNLRRLTLDEDYSIAGGLVTLTTPIAKRDRYQFNYMGLNTLAEFENEEIGVSCKFFSALPPGSRVEAYMDYLNIDQYYIQKLTERKFLEIVTVPQVSELLQQKGGGGGSGADSGSNDGFPNYQAGNANLYYLLRDEQIKKIVYVKLYNWYKQRLRYLAAEAQISLGFKLGNSTHYWTDGVNYSTQDSLVEQDINYTLTTQSILDQVENGFALFFPVGYKGASPKYYDRFGTEYRDYKDVFCYNLKDMDSNKTSGRVRSWKPYWAPKQDGKHSDLDYLVLRNRESELVQGYRVPFYSDTGVEDANFKEELIYDSDSNNYSFLKRVKVGDSVRIDKKKYYYKIGSIENRLDPVIGSTSGDSYKPLTEVLVLEEGKYFQEKGIKTYKVSKYVDVFPGNEKLLYRFSLNAGYLATDKEIDKFVGGLKDKFGYTDSSGNLVGSGGVQYIPSQARYYVKRSVPVNKVFSKNYIDVYVLFDVMETTFSDRGHRIYIKRASSEDFPVYNDEGNYGVTLSYDKIDGQITGKNRIRKPLTGIEVLSILFPIPFSEFPEEDELFETTVGTFDEESGEFILGSYNYEDESFVSDDEDSQKTINLKYLNFFDERRVDANLDALENNLVSGEVSGVAFNDDGYAVIDGVTYDGKKNTAGHNSRKLEEGDILPSHFKKGLGKFFDIDFERKYVQNEEDGYIDSIYFRTKSRDIWFRFPDSGGDDEVTKNLGVPVDQLLKGFYDPNNIYTKLVLEKQAWLTEQLIVQDIYDVQLKFARVFKDGIINAGEGKVSVGSEASNIAYSQYRSFLISIGNTIKSRMERYVNLLRYLLRDTPGDFGPIAGILQEDNASGPIIESYEKAGTAYQIYSSLLNRSFDDANSFYNRISNNLNLWNNAYIRWALSIREGTIFQMQAKNNQVDGSVVVGFNLIDAVKLGYETSTTTVILSNPKATVDYDYFNQSLRLKLAADYRQAPDVSTPGSELLSGSLESFYLFSRYTTLGSLVEAVNSNTYTRIDSTYPSGKDFIYPLGVNFFKSDMVFQHYPEGEYASTRLSPVSETDIPVAGLTLRVLNVDDHRLFDSRVLFLNKSERNSLALENEEPLNPWPTYVSYYNNPLDTNYADPGNYNPKKKAIQGLKVPGSWQQLPSSFYDVINFSPIQADHKTSYLITAVYDKDALDDIVKEQVLNLVLPDRSNVKDMIDLINKIDSTGTLTPDELTFIEGVDTSKRTKDTFVKFLTVKLTTFGADVVVRFNTRRFRTINDLVAAFNGYFYKDSEGEWQPAEDGADITGANYVRIFNASLIGDPLDQGQSSSFELQIPYAPIRRTFNVGPYTESYSVISPPLPGEDEPVTVVVEDEYYVTKQNILLGWAPETRTAEKGESVTLRLNDELEYSPGNTYGFLGLTGESARASSISINYGNKNANILPFDLYSWDANASFEVRANWLLMRSDIVQEAIPLTGAVGFAYFVSAVNNFVIGGSQTYPELKGETVGELVDRINTSKASSYFYANLKFVREEDENGNIGYFEYTYLPNFYSSIPQSSLNNLYLEDDPFVLGLTAARAQNAKYLISQVSSITADVLTISSEAKVFSLGKNTGSGKYSSISNASYDIDQGSSSLLLSADYVYSMPFSIDFELSRYATIGELISGNVDYDGISDQFAPLLSGPSVGLFTSSSAFSGSDPSTLKITSTLSLPVSPSVVLLKDQSNNNILSISAADIVDSRISLSNATVKVSAGILTLSATLTYTGSYSGSVSLAQVVSEVSEEVSLQYPLGDNGTYFPPLFVSSVTSPAYNNTMGTGVDDSGGSQALTSTIYAVVSTSEDFSMNSTVENLVTSINVKSPQTGVDASYLTSSDPGYKNLRAELIRPAVGDSYDVLNDIVGSTSLGANFSSEIGLNLLFMETGGSCSIVGSDFSVSTTLGSATYPQSVNKDLDYWVDTITGDFSRDLRSIDVLPIKIPGVSYGRLLAPASVTGYRNAPTHAYFGFLGDFKFTQISDYNLFTELSTIKQRLAKPWKDENGSFEDDWYNNQNYSLDFYGRTDSSADGNTTALHIEKFLGYLKNTRFSEIKNSISQEQLINNKYLWIYLKMHREIGCDQKVNGYLKKIKEDEKDAAQLPQDL